jgi:hypothetical protein
MLSTLNPSIKAVMYKLLEMAAHILARETYLNKYRIIINMPNGTSK